MNVTPFKELTLDQIKCIMDLCEGIYENSRKQNPSQFYSIDDCMLAEPCPLEIELDQVYQRLSKVALQELIALKLFGQRGFVRAHHWKTDMKDAVRHLDSPNILEGYGVGRHLHEGLRNLAKVRLLPGMPVWQV